MEKLNRPLGRAGTERNVKERGKQAARVEIASAGGQCTGTRRLGVVTAPPSHLSPCAASPNPTPSSGRATHPSAPAGLRSGLLRGGAVPRLLVAQEMGTRMGMCPNSSRRSTRAPHHPIHALSAQTALLTIPTGGTGTSPEPQTPTGQILPLSTTLGYAALSIRAFPQ